MRLLSNEVAGASGEADAGEDDEDEPPDEARQRRNIHRKRRLHLLTFTKGNTQEDLCGVKPKKNFYCCYL